MDETSLDINQIQWIQALWLTTSSVITIITLIRAVHLSQLHYCLDHPKSHYFDQNVGGHLLTFFWNDFSRFFVSFLPVNYFVTSNLSNLKHFFGYVFLWSITVVSKTFVLTVIYGIPYDLKSNFPTVINIFLCDFIEAQLWIN